MPWLLSDDQFHWFGSNLALHKTASVGATTNITNSDIRPRAVDEDASSMALGLARGAGGAATRRKGELIPTVVLYDRWYK
jgi:hypothetical protein